jgi:lipopolysaccharide export system permease protein
VILFRYVARRALAASAAALAGVVAVFLAVDFVDNAPGFRGPGWVAAALELYANKAVVVGYQVAPAALLLGAGIAASAFRQTREYTAMRSVGLGPWRLAGPIVAVALGAAVGLVLVNDFVGVRAAQRAEEIRSLRFGFGGDVRRYQAAHEPKRWFRGADGRRIYFLRGQRADGGFDRVTVLEVSPAFRLVRRIDAGAMRPVGEDAWVLDDVEDRAFAPDGSMRLERFPSRTYRFDEPPGAFSVVPGRPLDLRWRTLVAQIALRERLGLDADDFRLELHNRLAYPLMAVPAVLLAAALALRRARKGHVSAALVEAVGVSLAIWAVQGVSWALAGRVGPWVAAWGPDAIFLALGIAAVRRSV